MSHEVIQDAVIAPYSLGNATDIEGVWELLNGSGLQEGYVIQSESLSQLPGFSGSVINMLILLDLDGKFIDVQLLNHNEPIFVSGLGEAPFRKFLQQYRGLSINSPLTVGTNYGSSSGGSLTYLDGVTKATASVRIAHESILAAARDVAKRKLKGMIADQANVSPKPDTRENLDWEDLVSQGLAKHVTASHGEIRQAFADTKWRDDDPFSDKPDDEAYVDMWIVDVTAPVVARAVMKPRMYKDWLSLGKISQDDQTILLIEQGSHGLVGEEFVRNTSPTLIEAKQDDFPLTLRDSDLLIDLKPQVPEGVAMVFRIDRRAGFNPIRDWNLGLVFERQRGMFQPEVGQQIKRWTYKADERFFIIETPPRPLSPFEAAVISRWQDIAILSIVLLLSLSILIWNKALVRKTPYYTVRLVVLALTLGFIGWWGQGQLSIVTPLATLSAMLSGKSVQFLLYDPFSLLIWVVVLLSFFIWGRALFCGWLCPFGSLQEFVAWIAAKLKIPQVKIEQVWDERLKSVKYFVLLGLVLTAVFRPEHVDLAAEVEPFKTAISVFFMREWPFVLYAAICVLSSLFIHKAYCRFLCPLGAFMAMGGLLRIFPWIKRREDCGSPCQLCRHKCAYGAIKKTGEIQYSECFGCLECVDIFEDNKQCVPLIIAARKRERGQA